MHNHTAQSEHTKTLLVTERQEKKDFNPSTAEPRYTLTLQTV